MISIITPLYNSSRFIAETITSVLTQTFEDWEMILIDDCSTDDTVEVVNHFVARDSRLKLMRLEVNSGGAVARNAGIEAASRRFIAFLDSDDLWMPDKLEKQVSFMLSNRYAFTYSGYERINEYGIRLGNAVVPPEKITYRDMLKRSQIGCLTAMYDSQILGKIMMPLVRKRQDYGLWLRILREGRVAYCLEGVFAKYRVRENSVSSNKLALPKYHWILYRKHENLPFPIAAYYLVRYVLVTVFYQLSRRLT